MNLKLKTLLVLSGAVLLSVPVMRAQSHGFSGGAHAGSFAARPAAGHHSFAARGGNYGRGSYYRNGYGHGYGGYGHGYGRYYYLGGIPYFYPFYGFGYGYGGFYGDGYGGYGDGFYGSYAGGGYGDAGYNGQGGYGNEQGGYGNGGTGGGAYEGRITNGTRSGQNGGQTAGSGPSLPEAVQRQLSKRGYYKGTIDGQFGPASRDALKKFQKTQGLKPPGDIDEDSLDALGFTDKRQ